MNQFRPVTMIARTTPGTHNPRISAQTVTHRLREFGKTSPIYHVCFICGVFFFDLVYMLEFELWNNKLCIVTKSLDDEKQ